VTYHTYFTLAFFTSKYRMVLRYTYKCIVTYVHTKTTAFPAVIFTKLSISQQHYVQISCTEFHPNRTVNVNSRGRNTDTVYSVSLNKQTYIVARAIHSLVLSPEKYWDICIK
jgi:hypothetical protein